MILDIRQVKKTYNQPEAGTITVLDSLDLSLERGSTLAITGQSGSGKTTLLSLIAGLDAPDAGSIRINDTDITRLDQAGITRFRARNIGMIFQQFHLMPLLSARENVSLPLEIQRAPNVRKRTKAMLEKVGLSNRADHLPGQLSGGECQRVAIARALVIEPALLLADEPTGNLDLETGDRVADLLFDLVASHGTSLVVVTHNAELAGRCSRTRRLGKGVLS